MSNKISAVKKFSFLTLLLAFAMVAAACTPKAQQQAADTLTETPKEVVVFDEVSVALNTQNNSGEQGTVNLKRQGDSTLVTINLTGAPKDVPQPAHIHLSSCASIGGVKYPLSLVFNGKSETVVPANLTNLLNDEPLSINVHKSAEEAGVYVACGDLSTAAEVKAGDSASALEQENQPQDSTDSASGQAEQVRTISIDGFNFGYSAKEIKVKKGEKIKLVLKSTEGFHDWVVDELGVKTDRINTGQTTSVEFTPDKTGTFEFYCSVGSHRAMGMVGKIIVE